MAAVYKSKVFNAKKSSTVFVKNTFKTLKIILRLIQTARQLTYRFRLLNIVTFQIRM